MTLLTSGNGRRLLCWLVVARVCAMPHMHVFVLMPLMSMHLRRNKLPRGRIISVTVTAIVIICWGGLCVRTCVFCAYPVVEAVLTMAEGTNVAGYALSHTSVN
jgi:hypothetical protein